MLDIAVFSYDYPPNYGGISRLAGAVVAELGNRGIEVKVFTETSADRVGLSRPAVSTQETPAGRFWRYIATFGHLKRLPRDTSILATVWNPEATLAWLARHKGVVVMAHGNEVMPYLSKRVFSLKGWLRVRVLGAAHAVICNSRYTERLVLELNPNARTVVLCPAVDASRFAEQRSEYLSRAHFGLPATKRLILSVSRLDVYKGHDIVLRALARLTDESRDRLHYAVAGQGANLPVLQSLAEELGLSHCVSWLGPVADDALPGLYACADLFALCSREDSHALGVEGFGMVFLEAQAAGLAVLGTRSGGIPDAIVEGEGGWLVAQDDVAGVAKHLNLLAQDVAPFRQQGILGRSRVCREATWKQYVDHLLAVVNDERLP